MGIGKRTSEGSELSLKIVYWGPKGSGKTENITKLAEIFDDAGRLVTLVGEDGSTIYFDFLAPVIKLKNGCTVKYLLFASPGREAFKLSRQLVIQGADGIVFVVDSDKDRLEDNRKALLELKELLREHKKTFGKIPIVVQYNKRDLATAVPIEELCKELNIENYPYVEAETIRGIGVSETFKLIAKESLKNFIKKAKLNDFLCSL
jgi:signal recognition particle receptor subunit beta